MNHTAVAALTPLLMSGSQTRIHSPTDLHSTLPLQASHPSAVSVVLREGSCFSATSRAGWQARLIG